MNKSKELQRKIAKKLYELFVVNRNAMAIQLADGNYVTKYTKITENDILCMLVEGKAIGSYQQLYKSPYLKWICFDFDCKDKDKPNIGKLYASCTKPLNEYLDEHGISYVNEFSGRRGIHTWILFSNYVKKEDAYNLIQSIKKSVGWNYDNTEFGLDEFPSTFSSKGNVVGKQVKIPLSRHKKGGNSYLFKGDYRLEKVNDSFYEKQLNILYSVKQNNFEEISVKLDLNIKNSISQFVRTYSIGEVECDADAVINCLSKTEVYRALLDRVMHGEALLKDWLVMLGTLGKLGDGYRLLKDIFKYCPTFSEEETNDKIEKYGKKYFPATFAYLYNLYDLDMEDWINPTETGLQFLIRDLELDLSVVEWNQNETSVLSDSMYTVEKEKRYLFSNDEVPVVSIWDDLNHMTVYDTNKINDIVNNIKSGKNLDIIPIGFMRFARIESEEKERTMVSLSAYDRVLTSHIALNAFYRMNRSLKSYSYNPNYISSDEMFYHWYTSWSNYLSQIRKYIEVDLYSCMHVLTIDIKHFYDSIDFLGVYNLLKDNLSEEENNLFMALIKYNEQLMSEMNDKRIGVPQGPAYARLIAEIFLGTLIDKAISEFGPDRNNIFLYRYVDDIIVFHDDSVDSLQINEKLESVFSRHGLSINKDKSKIYGEIGKLTEKQKAELLRSDQFQYGLRISEYSYLTENQYVRDKVNFLIRKKGSFNAGDISFFFSRYADERAKKIYFSQFSRQIFGCIYGRGSGYQLFYRFIFGNADILEACLESGLFNLVPYNTINFSCLLATMFYTLKEDTLYPSIKRKIIDRYLKTIVVEDIKEGEDKSIILSLSKLEI
ncbi:reverse transcriptase domain-containing protein [uncultured Solobacterium sp.]|uniref:reverse transcriptase domain-containing protein n=1 Tax=uncultured Solobacterium sp. TaxID=747375 RepID=UPI0028D84435|nr:reverse transcriptase domain-containing protein [uncultured Solobacterium sp.]